MEKCVWQGELVIVPSCFMRMGGVVGGFMKVLIVAIVIGLVSGLMGALCGVGGGIVMVPAFVAFLGMAQKSAVATSLAVVVVTSVVSTVNHVRGGNLIDWRVVAMVGVASAVAAWYGTDLMRTLSNQSLSRVFGVVLVLVGVKMLMRN